VSVTIPFTFIGGTGNKARANEVNANFQAIAAKFTEGVGGIADADIYTGAGIRGSKLSSVPGNRITQAQMDDDAVDLRVLKDDATAGAPNAAVNTAAHIKDAIITNAKLVDSTIKKGKLNLASTTVLITGLTSGARSSTSMGINSSTAFFLCFVSETAPNVFSDYVQLIPFLDTGTGAYSFQATNLTGVSTGQFTVRVWYLVI